ncbi:lmo0954 family membrane protein [Bacillus massiliglaciei]|uniref:lmo0954 family membrane protein n=1 Tax=Bacillus massiliglaciei TaxID=1816693 RepID=UPI000DA61965|nr:flagellar basal body rod protein [Bacillus massiliglaciei]
MKKFGLFMIGLIALIILIANAGPLISLAICLTILYYAFKQFMKSETTGGKIAWGIISLIVLSMAVSHAPAILGIAAALLLYYVYKKWNEEEKRVNQDEDPFVNFEKEWKEITKN